MTRRIQRFLCPGRGGTSSFSPDDVLPFFFMQIICRSAAAGHANQAWGPSHALRRPQSVGHGKKAKKTIVSRSAKGGNACQQALSLTIKNAPPEEMGTEAAFPASSLMKYPPHVRMMLPRGLGERERSPAGMRCDARLVENRGRLRSPLAEHARVPTMSREVRRPPGARGRIRPRPAQASEGNICGARDFLPAPETRKASCGYRPRLNSRRPGFLPGGGSEAAGQEILK